LAMGSMLVRCFSDASGTAYAPSGEHACTARASSRTADRQTDRHAPGLEAEATNKVSHHVCVRRRGASAAL
jgi:hypothetical protein